mmetsp:Transcript_62457/g.148747  ORF Transcript_62457/g.148747 Transcript_62457/m.148747 type:complete len:215 (+) Transcript_62457:230-874(+)
MVVRPHRARAQVSRKESSACLHRGGRPVPAAGHCPRPDLPRQQRGIRVQAVRHDGVPVRGWARDVCSCRECHRLHGAASLRSLPDLRQSRIGLEAGPSEVQDGAAPVPARWPRGRRHHHNPPRTRLGDSDGIGPDQVLGDHRDIRRRDAQRDLHGSHRSSRLGERGEDARGDHPSRIGGDPGEDMHVLPSACSGAGHSQVPRGAAARRARDHPA